MRRILSLLYTFIFIICIYPHPANSVDGMQFMYNCPICDGSSDPCPLLTSSDSRQPCTLVTENGKYEPCCKKSNDICILEKCELKCFAGYYESDRSCKECPAGYYCPGGMDKQTCPAGTYSGAGATSCEECPAGYYCPGGMDKQKCPGKQDNSNVICNSEKTCAENDYVTDLKKLIEIYEKRQINNAYPQKITAITSVAIPSYLTSATKITECGVTYTITNQRGTFVQEQIMYTEKQYDNPNNQTIFYTKILPGYYANTQLYTQEQCTSERQKLYTDAVPCPAGQYCTGFEDGMPACDGNYPNSLGISGNIAAGYYSNGGGTKNNPNGVGDGCLSDNECGTIAAGYYSTGGGTKNKPNGVGDGCLSGNECGPCDSGTYSEAGASKCTPCQAGYYSSGGASICTICPVGTTSNAGATAITNCYIKGGTEGTKFCINNNNCFYLPAGININLKSVN